MPERLMGTDCKFVGNMSTLVQIQLGPIIRRSAMKRYNPFVVLQKCSIPIGKKSKIFWYISTAIYLLYFFFQQIFRRISIHIKICKLSVKSKEKSKIKKKRAFSLKDLFDYPIDLAITKRLLVIHAAFDKVDIHKDIDISLASLFQHDNSNLKSKSKGFEWN